MRTYTLATTDILIENYQRFLSGPRNLRYEEQFRTNGGVARVRKSFSLGKNGASLRGKDTSVMVRATELEIKLDGDLSHFKQIIVSDSVEMKDGEVFNPPTDNELFVHVPAGCVVHFTNDNFANANIKVSGDVKLRFTGITFSSDFNLKPITIFNGTDHRTRAQFKSCVLRGSVCLAPSLVRCILTGEFKLNSPVVMHKYDNGGMSVRECVVIGFGNWTLPKKGAILPWFLDFARHCINPENNNVLDSKAVVDLIDNARFDLKDSKGVIHSVCVRNLVNYGVHQDALYSYLNAPTPSGVVNIELPNLSMRFITKENLELARTNSISVRKMEENTSSWFNRLYVSTKIIPSKRSVGIIRNFSKFNRIFALGQQDDVPEALARELSKDLPIVA